MRELLLIALMAVAGATALAESPGLPPLPDGTLAGWTRYVDDTARRIRQETAGGAGFLALDFSVDAPAQRKAVLAGGIVTRQVSSAASHLAIDVPSAAVHHWRGAVLLPEVSLRSLLDTLEREAPNTGQEDVLRASVIDRGPESLTVFLKVRRTKFVSVVYNTEHVVRFHQLSTTRAWSESTATKIAELADANEPSEHEVAQGHDRGFLWRWNSYWRYEQVPAGVIAECESISLSRTVPFGLRTLLGPLVSGTARESMERTLSGLREYFDARFRG